MKRYIFAFFLVVCALMPALCADPMSTDFSYVDCQGSLKPYPQNIKQVGTPDSLVAVMVNHVGRHGARYPASAGFCKTLKEALQEAKEQGSITTLGKRLLYLTEYVMELSEGHWGALDSLGEYEQRMIASRMIGNFPAVFENAKVSAMSSYSPRAMMSMYCFTHQLDRMNNRCEFATSTGRQNSNLLRPFDTETDYIDFIKSGETTRVYNEFFEQNCPTTAIDRVLGSGFAYTDEAHKRQLAITEYYVLAGLSAMSVHCELPDFFTQEEINALWACFNLRQYLQRTATTLSTIPADIAATLLMDIISTTDAFVDGTSDVNVRLRFGHAETLMPLLSMMHLQGCFYMTNYFDTVAKHWQDFHVVPMAANIQLILFKNPKNGMLYLRVDLNEVPIPLIPNSQDIYTPWDKARRYLMKCVPLHAQ